MKALVLLFWQMLRFKREPEDAPYSVPLLLVIIAINFVLAATAQAIGRPSQLNIAIVSPIISIGVELLFVYLLLQLKNLNARFVQTEISVMACDTLLTLAAIPLLIISINLPSKSPVLAFLGLFELVLVIWGIMVRGFIYHRALNISPFLANTLAFLLLMVSLSITVKVFPELLAQATAAAAQTTTPSR
jgi:hypothetical protein